MTNKLPEYFFSILLCFVNPSWIYLKITKCHQISICAWKTVHNVCFIKIRSKHSSNTLLCLLRVCCGPCNPSKWKVDIWGWLEVRRSAMLHFNKRQRPHWACRQYGHTKIEISKQQWVTGFHCVWSVVGWLMHTN